MTNPNKWAMWSDTDGLEDEDEVQELELGHAGFEHECPECGCELDEGSCPMCGKHQPH
jgi:hypothetical protein